MIAIKALCIWLAAANLRRAEGLVQPMTYLPADLQGYLDTCHSTGDLTQQSARLVFWTAINQYTSRFVQSRPNLSPQQVAFLRGNLQSAFDHIHGVLPIGRKKRQALGRRVRKEIRAMTLDERVRYFAAVNALKADTRLPPNVYDFLAAYHRGENIQRAHFGPAFPSWHRLFLWIYEYFLRQHDPSVTVPFWASIMDNDMEDSTQSVLWSPAFYGNGDGAIRTGPFRNWPQINPETSFTRNVQDTELYTAEGIDRMLSRSRNAEILIPTANASSNFEIQHGAAHVAVGGSMNSLETAATDPIFFSHHAFVDQIWERFRFNQRSRGINPETDYPFNSNDPRFRDAHMPLANAGFEGLQGAQSWTQNLGYLNAFSDFVAYEEVPACPLCANSPFLYCNQNINRCVSRTIGEMASSGLLNSLDTTPTRGKRGLMQRFNGADVCSRRHFLHDIDLKRTGLSFSHSNDWSYIPVKIVSKRPVEYDRFNKYSLYNHGINAQFGLKNEFFKRGIQRVSDSCEKRQDSVSKITVVSYGLNYDGYAEEYVLLDNRLGMAEGNGFIPIKTPRGTAASDVMIAAFDSCGRICKPYCKQGTANAGDIHFSGGIRITSASPRQYANSYADSLLHVWDIPSSTSCPRVNYDNVPVSFFCEYTDTWIWDSGNPRSNLAPSGAWQGGPPLRAGVSFHGSAFLPDQYPARLRRQQAG